jgi:transposase
MKSKKFFKNIKNIAQKRYEALRAFYYEGKNASYVAKKFGYTKNAFYSMARNFNKYLKEDKDPVKRFFVTNIPGPKKYKQKNIRNFIIMLRKKYLSVPDIKSILDSQEIDVSETFIYKIIKQEGFAKLPRRGKLSRNETRSNSLIRAPQSILFNESKEKFSSSSLGILCFIPYITNYGIDKIILKSKFPETKIIPKLNSILSFLALKLSNVSRYSKDDIWCMDRGLGLFAGLNVLPKASWLSSYSHRVTKDMNISFLKNLNKIWKKHELLSDTVNLDFTALPYWGEDTHLENNWSGKRNKAIKSILAALAHDPDSGIITYGDTTVRRDNQKGAVLEFLDFYKKNSKDLKYLVFDSKFTTYQNLKKLDDDGIKFLTIRKRGKKIVEELESLQKTDFKKIRVQSAKGARQIKVTDTLVFLRGYGEKVRQIAITGNKKIKPALIITNDFDLKIEDVVRKYARRWLIEKSISEQIHFFHLNKVNSSIVIKVDFDLTMTILANNLYRLFARDLMEYSNHTSEKLYEKFIYNSGKIEISNEVIVSMKKKRHYPILIEALNLYKNTKISWLENKKIKFEADSTS